MSQRHIHLEVTKCNTLLKIGDGGCPFYQDDWIDKCNHPDRKWNSLDVKESDGALKNDINNI